LRQLLPPFPYPTLFRSFEVLSDDSTNDLLVIALHLFQRLQVETAWIVVDLFVAYFAKPNPVCRRFQVPSCELWGSPRPFLTCGIHVRPLCNRSRFALARAISRQAEAARADVHCSLGNLAHDGFGEIFSHGKSARRNGQNPYHFI